MAILIYADGRKVKLSPKNKKRGFSQNEICNLIGCETFNVLQARDKTIIITDKNNSTMNKKINEEASKLYYGCLVGTVLLCSKKEIE